MTEVENIKQLYNYDLWANKRIANALNGQLHDNSKKCLDFLAHIRASQQIWYARIIVESTTDIELWPENGYAEDSIQKLQEMHSHWISLISDNQGTFNRMISYKNSKGIEFSTPLEGILQHLIIHGQHHRAQIALLLRQSGIDPPGTDYIFYLRKHSQQ